MARDLSWRDAIYEVLNKSSESMHYVEISEAITEEKLRNEVGATPAATVAAVISGSLQNEGVKSPFIRIERGRYWLRHLAENPQPQAVRSDQPGELPAVEPNDSGLINAFGMFWSRRSVLWSSRRILGQQQLGSTSVDFFEQKGVYLLHDGRTVIYVGRTTDQPLGVRLRQHTVDRLNGRWDRFSWFGVYSVADDGVLKSSSTVDYDLTMLIVTMEALLIEGLEPPQNRKRGDEFRAAEFLQVEDPEIQRSQSAQLLNRLLNKL